MEVDVNPVSQIHSTLFGPRGNSTDSLFSAGGVRWRRQQLSTSNRHVPVPSIFEGPAAPSGAGGPNKTPREQDDGRGTIAQELRRRSLSTNALSGLMDRPSSSTGGLALRSSGDCLLPVVVGGPPGWGPRSGTGAAGGAVAPRPAGGSILKHRHSSSVAASADAPFWAAGNGGHAGWLPALLLGAAGASGRSGGPSLPAAPRGQGGSGRHIFLSEGNTTASRPTQQQPAAHLLNMPGMRHAATLAPGADSARFELT